jgi:ATP-dependent DNA helicase RecQ
MSALPALHAHGLQLLRQALNDPAADFRDGQWQAIESVVQRRARLLLVQRTGWGKSAVYFLSTRLLRDQGAGPTLLVSPLLALMRNQIDAAVRLGVRAETVNSTNPEDWEAIEQRLRADAIDVLIVSPERFANEKFLNQMLLPFAARVGLFVVDEAHCISDWGHDFRPDYRRIVRILDRLPANVPVCATTATANDRVTADVAAQLGGNLEVCRGPLVRDSLHLQTVALPDDAAKLAWLAHYIPSLRCKSGKSGIVYALTIRWTERIAAWLQGRGIRAEAYHAGLANEERQEREGRLLDNDIDALIATTALGMGYDKPDLGFVVHFHQPGSVVHYYQQVGRAGRCIPDAYGVMLSGGDDRDINDYFIEQAFPPEEDVVAILDALELSAQGLTTPQLEAVVNLSRSRIDNVLKTLAVETPPPLARLESRWVTTPQRYDPERRRRLIEHLTRLRRSEQAQMDRYRGHTGCLMEFLARALDDPAAATCGRCAFCKGQPDALRRVPEDVIREAITYLRRCNLPIEPRVQWQAGALPVYGWQGRIAADRRAEVGRALCILGDSGWGSLVRRGKYQEGRFAEELVEALAGLVRGWRPAPPPTWVTCVPSLDYPELVPDLARGLSARLSLPFVSAVRKVRASRPQKDMENSWQQVHNLDGAFQIDPWQGMAGPVLLVDDLVDSRWTFTVVAALLRQEGSGPVFPLALAANR